ncbi:PorP/SprF family type IX secretion system membrane protein [Desertivirga xinjiangensis]|uniref:PorP/SprF family type IX secretion system membrane protein n=1 Tax=Desertivirga xinjiangensis TaxID=539206 RepID=UPI0021089B75|nr:PorP/SprF family type IX secretion system membrane protein [Pedobacter xinjiangensis]
MKLLNKYLAGALLLTGLFSSSVADAQISSLGNMYYQNQYMANPAFAGMEEGLNANLVYREQFNQMPDGPVTQSFTGAYGIGKKVGVGVNLNFEKSGIINQTRLMATYAYHLPVTETGKLSFGLSLGLYREYINNSDVTGDDYDPVTSRFNDRGNRLDGDFGIAYSGSRLSLQGAVLNLRNYLETDPNYISGTGYATFFSSVAYKWTLNEEFSTEPKLAYRGIKGFDNILDAGVNVAYLNRFNVFAMYHTTKSATMGFGVKYNDVFTFTGAYTTNTSAMRSYSNGDFEVGINVKLKKKNQQ